MKRLTIIKNFAFVLSILAMALTISSFVEIDKGANHRQNEDKDLFETISKMDSLYFSAYNHCDLATQASMLSDSVEFYHDQGGLSTSKKDILEKTKENICGKITREVVAGSIEVYPIKDYGAVEIGMHKFHNNQEPTGTPSRASKFIVIWQQQNNSWQMARVISLH